MSRYPLYSVNIDSAKNKRNNRILSCNNSVRLAQQNMTAAAVPVGYEES